MVGGISSRFGKSQADDLLVVVGEGALSVIKSLRVYDEFCSENNT